MTPLGISIAEGDRSKFRLLWHAHFWDGPLSGLAIYEGRKVWFSADDSSPEDEAETERMFRLYELTPQELQQHESRHALFVQYVGGHTDYDPVTQKRDHGKVRPRQEWDKFYGHK